MTYHLAQTLDVRLVEASPVTGGLIFAVVPPVRGKAPAARQKTSEW